MRTRLIYIAAIPSLLAGCASDLSTRNLDPLVDDGKLQAGFVYYLPAATVTPTASLRIAGCIADEASEKLLRRDGHAGPPPIVRLETAISGDLSVEQVQGLPIVIDYRRLGGFMKTADLTLERQSNGMLKSIGVTIEDQAPSVIADGVVIAAGVALAVTAPPAALPALTMAAAAASGSAPIATGSDLGTSSTTNPKLFQSAPPPPVPATYLACSPETIGLLTRRATAVANRDADARSLTVAGTTLAKLLRRSDPGYTEDDRTQIAAVRRLMLDLTSRLEDDRKAISEIDSDLSLPLRPGSNADVSPGGVFTEPLTLAADEERLRAFVRRHVVVERAMLPPADAAGLQQHIGAAWCKGTEGHCTPETAMWNIADALGRRSVAILSARAVPRPTDGFVPDLATDDAGRRRDLKALVRAGDGIVYVEPAVYEFVLRRPPDPDAPGAEGVILKSIKASVPQLGTYLVLPIHSGFGQKATLKATFNVDGSLATAGYGRPTSAGKALSASAAATTTAYLASRGAVEDRKLKLLNAEADRLKAQKAVADAETSLKDDPLADLKARIALVSAQATLAEANLRLIAANEKLSPP